MIESVYRSLARVYPWSVSASEGLVRAVRFLQWSITPAMVVKGGFVGGGFVGLWVLCLGVLLGPRIGPAWLGVACGSALVAVHGLHRLPVGLAHARRSTALGAAPGLIGRAVLRMRIDPNPERAATFAADHGDGTLAASLRAQITRAAATPTSGLVAFSEAWRPWFPALSRAVHLLTAAAQAPPARRERTLDRALTAVLDGTAERMHAFAARATGPITAIYAFGVLLPLALVAILPGVRMAGIEVTLPALIVVYNIVLPLGLLGATGWLVTRRPVAFPPPHVSRSHPAVPDRRRHAVGAGIVAAGCGAVGATVLVGRWAGAIAAVGLGGGVMLVVWYHAYQDLRKRVHALEADLPDALYLIGQQVTNGAAVEHALRRAAAELDGPLAEELAAATGRHDRLAVSIETALTGAEGAFETVPSQRLRSMATLLVLAAREGSPAGHAIVAMADHLDELQTAEQDAIHSLTKITSTLKHTAAVFGPLVAGATVALAEGLTAFDTGEEVATLPVAATGSAVGVYVLLMAVILIALATVLESGFDRPAVGYRMGLALCAATTVYVVALYATGLVV